ncbi:MAG: ABC transporter substrate-binding protein [Thermoplasmatales archaeon]|nr:ABC transporter substrate-binding protein [Thermoplasmatales archaeon]
MTDNQKDNQQPASPPTPTLPKKQGSRNTKWYAIIVVLVVIIAAFGVLAFYHPTPTVPVGTSASITSSNSGAVAQYNKPYNLSIKTNGKFSSANLFWGDGSPQVIPYSGSDYLNVSHIYDSPGNYYLYYTVNFTGNAYSSNKELLPIGVSVSSSALPATNSYGDIALESSSASPIVNNSWIYAPGTTLSLLLAYFTPPANPTYQVVSQTLTVSHNDSVLTTIALPYYFNESAGIYELSTGNALYNLTLSAGYYQVELTTFTAAVNSTSGSVNAASGIFNTEYYQDIPVFSSASVFSAPTGGVGTFVNAEAETGGYKTLDPAVTYDGVSLEISFNTMATLFGYNGSSSSEFFPYLAAYMPTTTNGGINTNWANYTVKVNSTLAGYNGGSYNVTIKPYENYTIHIRSNATFADGNKVTAWDVAFSLTRLLLYDNGAPGTPGWINAQYMLPGNYYSSNTFWNITQNITWNNATNNITIHYQLPMAPSLVFETLGDTSGAFITEASWVQTHGGGIGWNASDFEAYQAHASAGDYISYLVNNEMASGPYMIDYTVPASETVLVANPNYNPPGNGFAVKAKIPMVIIEYIGQESTQYLMLKSGYAQVAKDFPSSAWYQIQGLSKSGTVDVYSFPTISIYYYDFNVQINETLLSAAYPTANVPQTFFDSIQVRRAFADAYDYSYYLAQQIGNEVYNTTFGTGYAGMLPNGMLGYQSNQSLISAGVSLPQFDMTGAEKNWTSFENSQYFSMEGLSVAANGNILYKGAVLNIPVFVWTADPVDVEGATTWGQYLAQIIPGIQTPVVPTSIPTLLGWMVAGQNPAPIYLMNWGPDYPYPTDYMGPMAYPSSVSFFPGASGFYPSWFNNTSNPVSSLAGMKEQYNNLTAMAGEYLAGATTGDPTVALKYFHMQNEMLVNMTFYVYLYQVGGFWVVNSHVTPSSVTAYQDGVMVGGDGVLMYDYLSYS